jgi:hypothetical protein
MGNVGVPCIILSGCELLKSFRGVCPTIRNMRAAVFTKYNPRTVVDDANSCLSFEIVCDTVQV